MEEKWMPIKGYENLYEVSNLGNVRSTNYRKSGKPKNLKISLNKKGYYTIRLSKNAVKKTYRVNRLVAMAFISIPEKYKDIPISVLQVDHINTIRTDNRVENLQWVTNKENSNNPFTVQHNSKSQKNYWNNVINLGNFNRLYT